MKLYFVFIPPDVAGNKYYACTEQSPFKVNCLVKYTNAAKLYIPSAALKNPYSRIKSLTLKNGILLIKSSEAKYTNAHWLTPLEEQKRL